MNEVLTIVKTIKVVMRDGRIFPVTERQYMTLKSMKCNDKPTKMVCIREEKDNSILFEGELRDIKEFQHKSRSKTNYRYICDYCGKSVPLYQDCPDNDQHWEERVSKRKARKKYNWEEITEYKQSNYKQLINQLV